MSPWSEVFAAMPCKHCAAIRRVSVEIRGYYSAEQFDEGDIVANATPGECEAFCEAYCSACRPRWLADFAQVYFDRIAELVEQGAIVERPSRSSTAAAIRAFAKAYDNETKHFAVVLGEAGILLTTSDGTIRVSDTGVLDVSGWEWWALRDAEVSDVLRTRGWPLGTEDLLEPKVVIDQQLRINVHREDA